jgi:hypothetical protein
MIVLNHRGYAVVVGSKHVATLNPHGHEDWRLPTKVELDVLFNNRAAIGGFEPGGAYPKAWYWWSSPAPENWYWSSTENRSAASFQRFGDGRKIGQKCSVVRIWEA